MKNLIVALSLLFAVSVSAQAKKQTTYKVVAGSVKYTPSTPEQDGLKNITELEKTISLNPDQKAMLQELFTTKYRMLTENGVLSVERKNIISDAIASKLASSVDAGTLSKIKANKALYSSLIN